MKIVKIDWLDAQIVGSDTYSRKEAEQRGLIQVESVGILVSENKKEIVIATDYFPEHDTFRSIQVYPKSGIKRITRMKVTPITNS